MAKAKKKKASKYEEKFKFNGSFEYVIKLSVRDADKDAKEKDIVKKTAKKK